MLVVTAERLASIFTELKILRLKFIAKTSGSSQLFDVLVRDDGCAVVGSEGRIIPEDSRHCSCSCGRAVSFFFFFFFFLSQRRAACLGSDLSTVKLKTNGELSEKEVMIVLYSHRGRSRTC